ncbi:MAG: hypothetical protein KIT83_20565 [Bryobacterales bacterium]|nr:hypothetical protein [Bryobacterales bacterium]
MAFLLVSLLPAVAQQAQQSGVAGSRSPVAGTFRPSPQTPATRLVALVPVVPVPGVTDTVAPKFLEDEYRSASNREARTRTDSGKAVVPSGIVSYRVMMSADDKWALIDVQSKDPIGLATARTSKEFGVRIFQPEELDDPMRRKAIVLPEGLSLEAFLSN